MPFPRVRFTVRRMMVAVAITAAILGVYRLLPEEPPEPHRMRWAPAYPGQPMPEEVAQALGVNNVDISHLLLALPAVGLVFLWPSRTVAPDPPEPE